MSDIPEGRDWIYKQYVILGKGVIQIADEFNCNRCTIKRRLDKYNIKRRRNYNIPTDKDWIHKQYITLEKSIIQIARDFNCDRTTIERRLIEYNIPRRGNKEENNWRWEGDKVGCGALHIYIRRRKPKPELCEKCGKVPPFDLSCNGIYDRNPNSYEWLCRRCHLIKDGVNK